MSIRFKNDLFNPFANSYIDPHLIDIKKLPVPKFEKEEVTNVKKTLQSYFEISDQTCVALRELSRVEYIFQDIFMMTISIAQGRDINERTIAHLAITRDSITMLKVALIVDDELLNAKDKDGISPYLLACAQGRTDMIELMLDRSIIYGQIFHLLILDSTIHS